MQAGRLLLWSCLWGGGVAWLVHLLSIWLLAEFGCLGALAEPGPLDVSRVAWLVLAASALCFVAAGVATLASWRCRRHGGDAGAGEDAEAARFVSRYGLVANPLFMLIILAQTLPVFFHLSDCASPIAIAP